MVRSTTNSGWSAATQVKVVSPEIFDLQGARGCFALKPVSWRALGRRVCHGMPGSQAAAGHPTDCIGTWESRIACMPQQAEKARRGQRDTAVGPARSRGVVGVMPGAGPGNRDPLEGAGSWSNRAADVEAMP